ncbi:MAG TPA: hypothetical protein VIK14_03725 [Ignavibacteria bacterium]
MVKEDKTVEMSSQEWEMDPCPYEFSLPCITKEEIYQYIYFHKVEFLQKCAFEESEMYRKIAAEYKKLNNLDPGKFNVPE